MSAACTNFKNDKGTDDPGDWVRGGSTYNQNCEYVEDNKELGASSDVCWHLFVPKDTEGTTRAPM